ncbi:guanine-1-methyltransferase-domain-containing protein, partial [Infundibulicybe gibba]
LSKSAAKKAARAERYAATKLERRAKEKAAKRAKKQERALKRAAGELDSDDNAAEERARHKKRLRATTADGATHPFGGRIVLDLGFDDMMNDKEISSLCSQLAYTYSVNRAAAFPFRLLYTGLSGRTFARLERMSDAGYKRWTHTEWWHDGYDRLWKEDPDVRESVVYLTADADEELAELDPGTTYIIGGICDHNRYKNLCLNKARDGPIRAARLPIGRYLAALSTRKVLTVNQVFEILIKWVELRDWAQALEHVVPKRKF